MSHCLFLAAVLLATGPVLGAQEKPPGTGTRSAQEEREATEALRAIGYIDYAEEAGEGTDGVVLLDPELSAAGYNLCAHIPIARAELLDARGRVVHAWDMKWWRSLARCELLADGDLLALGNATEVARVSWEGEVVWLREIGAHHDVELTPRGEVLVLTREDLTLPDVHAEHLVRDNFLQLLSLAGEPLGKRSLFGALSSRPEQFRLGPGEIVEQRERQRMEVEDHRENPPPVEEQEELGKVVDLLHGNSVEWIDRPDLALQSPLYEEGNVLTSIRSQNTVAIVNFERGELLWAWGRGEIIKQHEATLLPGGNVLLLDNGNRKRGYSRVLEVDPRSGEIVWEYKAPRPEDFFTAARGTVQALAGANVLVSNTNSGEAFEVTREGEVVWRYLSPHKDDKDRRAVIRVKRYADEFVDSILRESGRGDSSGR